MTDAHKGFVAWAAVVAPTWLVLVLCTHWEPVQHDGWYHWDFHRHEGLSFSSFADFVERMYTTANPRLGQLFTLLVYTPGPWHSIVTPLVVLALFYLLTLLVLGRRPSLQRAEDALLFVTILATCAVVVPAFGLMLFYRPFMGNYLFGLVLTLLLVAPYRLHYAAPLAAKRWWAPALAVLGFAAGMCNEHTGPAFAALLGLALVVFWRRGTNMGTVPIRRLPAWAIAGLVGFLAGGLALYFAPGQDLRYSGLAQQAGALERIADRGLWGNAVIFRLFIAALVPLLAWFAVGVIARYVDRSPRTPRPQLVVLLAGVGVALAITATLLLSPKQGERLYLAATAITCAAASGWVVAQLVSRWTRTFAASLAAGVLLFAGYQLTGTYHQLAREYRARVEILEAAPDHSVARIPVYTVKRSRWSWGDDLLTDSVRNLASSSFGLALIELDQREPTTAVPDEP